MGPSVSEFPYNIVIWAPRNPPDHRAPRIDEEAAILLSFHGRARRAKEVIDEILRDLAPEPRTVHGRMAEVHPAKNAGVHNHFEVWSPVGAFIYFVRGFPPDQMDVWRIRADGGTPERLTFHESRVLFPTFADSRTLLYLATADDGSGPWVHALNVDRRISQRLNTGVDPYRSIAASADGRRIVGAVSRSTSGLWPGTIDERPIDESRAVRIALPTAHALSPRFGPDYMLYRASTSGTDGVWKLGERQKATELWNARDGRVVAAPCRSTSTLTYRDRVPDVPGPHPCRAR